MAIHRNVRFNRRPLTLALAAALFAHAGMVHAQDAKGDEDPATKKDEISELDTVKVTGSRIQRAGFDTLEPATVVGEEYLQQRGITNVADALNEIPGFGTGVTPEGGQSSFGVGVNFVNRFGLGSNRTLTLINGRRSVSSNPPTIFGPGAPGVQVDLNMVPTSMVDRVENLAVGGAPTYGADAIAGVVNLILKRDYEGTEIGGNFGITGQGDNQRINGYALWGMNFGENDRGNITVNVSYDTADGVLQMDRDYYAAGYFTTGNPLASTMAALFPGRTPANDGRWNPAVPFNTGTGDGIPNSVLITGRHIWTTPFGGLISPVSGAFKPGSGNLIPNGFGPGGNTVLQFDGSGNLVPFNPGSTFTATDASGGDGLFLTEGGQITSDLTRKTVFSTFRWGVTDNIDFFAEGSYYRANSTELTDQWMYNSPLFGGLSRMITVPANHPMLTAQAKQKLSELGVSSFNLSRASRDLVTNNARGTTTTGRVVAGLEGDFELAERTFYWESSANWGRTRAEYFGTSLDQQKFVNAMHACSATPLPGLIIPGAGAVAGTPIADPSCVALDIFGDGRPSQAARDYVTEQTRSWSVLEQRVFNINMSSDLFDLWAGPIQYNIGYEYRNEFAEFQPGAFLEAGLGRSVAITPLKGSYSTNELFGEFIFPLLDGADRTFFKKLDLIGKYRSVDNEINGRAGTYTYGLQFKPVEDLELRGNFTRAIRAPAITELFLPQASSFQFVTNDPCDSRFINTGPNPSVRATNCAAFLNYYGLTSFTSTAHSASIQGINGGNPNLDNEVADSHTYGFTWAPSFFEGFTLAADYYKIEIDQVIASLTAANLASACFDSTNFDTSNVPHANAYCSQIIRNAPGSPNNSAGQATSFVSGFVNGRYLNMKAYSTEARYSWDAGDLGQFTLSWVGYFPRSLVTDVTGVSPTEQAGTIGTSKKQHQFNVNWDGEKLGLNLSANYLSDAAFNLTNTAETQDIWGVGDYMLLNAGGNYRFSDNLTLRLAITNLLDVDPPFPTAGIGNYDILGRRYNLSFQWNF
ncbi:MAG TPA: TonB-dependent receptor [Thermomonas sp.]|nr:TonB-dependent receptor [Thermomonas sp.]